MIFTKGNKLKMDIVYIENELKKIVTPKRFQHSVGVRYEAVKLAKQYGADEKKAELAGLVHDCAKDFEYEQMLKMCDHYGVILDTVSLNEKKLIHSQLGAMYAKKVFCIDDDEIYDAVFYHTTAKANMSMLTKIIYIADYIEPNRTFEGVDELRQTAYINIDNAILTGLDFTINQLVSEKKMLHPETINARNDIILKMRCKND